MIDMTERTRTRWLWLLAAVTAAYGLANVLLFFTTGSFGALWFATGVFVYGILLVSALALSLLDTGRPEEEAEPARAEPEPEAELGTMIDHETVYETRTGRVLRARFGHDGNERTLVFALVGDEVLPAHALESRLTDVETEAPAIEDVGEVEDAIDRRTVRGTDGHDDLAEIDVELLDREVLHESPSGSVLRARYRAGDEEHVRLFAITEDRVVPVEEIEGDLDELRVDEVPVDAETVFEEMLTREVDDEDRQADRAEVTTT